ncbi:MAG TPA: hypothetical protein VHB53_13375 [Solirubrobacterales bacterium]|nr:hypothetical protein [Solirubrobacterales bacterium]
MSSEGPARRREIEDSTTARLAEIVATAERAARQVIDEAEEEARARLAGADEEARQMVVARLAGLAEMTEEIDAQAEALRFQAEALRQTLARLRAELGRIEAPGEEPTLERGEEPGARRPPARALTVVEDAPDPPAKVSDQAAPADSPLPDPRAIGHAAGARLLATQMAVSGSSRAEIEARLRDGFGIADTGPILDAILGPER